jgi:hypothetical protein
MADVKKGNQVWESFKNSVPGLSERFAATERPPGDAQLEFRQLAAGLPGALREQVTACRTEDAGEDWSRDLKPVWCLCDMAEGEFPRVFQYASLQELAAAMTKAEGRETALSVFYGVALPFSKPQVTNEGKRYRYLLLPNDMAAVLGDPFQLVEQSLLSDNLELEEQGWVGDPAYLDSPTYYSSGYMTDNEFSNDPEFEDDEDL